MKNSIKRRNLKNKPSKLDSPWFNVTTKYTKPKGVVTGGLKAGRERLQKRKQHISLKEVGDIVNPLKYFKELNKGNTEYKPIFVLKRQKTRQSNKTRLILHSM